MVGALPLEVLVSLPDLIKGLSIPLNKRRDLSPQLCSLARWKVFVEERLGECIPGGERVGLPFCSQSLALSLSEKGKSRSLIASLDAPLILMVSHFARNLRRCTLGFSDACPANCSRSIKEMSAGELEVVSLNCGANNRGRKP